MPDLSLVTAADFKARYPTFNDVGDGQINAILDEARGSVGASWIEGDQKPALLALAAHLLATDLYGSGTIAVEGIGQIAVTGALEEIAIGDVKTKFAHKFASDEGAGSSSPSSSGFAATTYGRRYLELYRRSFPAIMVV